MPKRMSREKFDSIVELLQDGQHNNIAIGEMAGVDSSAVSAICHGRHFSQASDAEQERRLGGSPPKYLPTPDEIAAACERIQAERRRTAVEDEPDGWMPPVVTGRMLPGV